MRKIPILMGLVLMCLCLTSCTVINAWVIKGTGKDLKGTYQVAGGQASNVDAVFARTLVFTTYRIDERLIKSLPNARVTIDSENKIKSVEIGSK